MHPVPRRKSVEAFEKYVNGGDVPTNEHLLTLADREPDMAEAIMFALLAQIDVGPVTFSELREGFLACLRADMVPIIDRLRAIEHSHKIVPPRRIDMIDVTFRKWCVNRGATVLRIMQLPDNHEEIKSAVYLVLDADGLVKVFKEIVDKKKMLHGVHFVDEDDVYELVGEHPLFARCYGVSEVGDYRFLRLSMEYGVSLDDVGRVTFQQMCSIVAKIAEAVKYLHDLELWHGDVSPRQIRIHEGQVKLLDFSHARAAVAGDIDTTCSDTMYAAPEEMSTYLMSAKTEVYRLGLIAHQLLTGSPHVNPRSEVWDATTEREQLLVYSLPRLFHPYELRNVPVSDPRAQCLKRMLARDPHMRPTIDEVWRVFKDSFEVELTPPLNVYTPRLRERNTVMFPARMGIPHKGHIEFIDRLIQCGFHVDIVVGHQYTCTDRDPLRKTDVARMVARSLALRGHHEESWTMNFAPFYETPDQSKLHYLMLPSGEDLVAVASGNPQVSRYISHLPLIDQRAVFGHEQELFETRSWGAELRSYVRSGDRAKFRELAARGVLEIVSFEELQVMVATFPRIHFVNGVQGVRLRLIERGQELFTIRPLAHASPEESIVRSLHEHRSTVMLKGYFRRSVLLGIGEILRTLRYVKTFQEGEMWIEEYYLE